MLTKEIKQQIKIHAHTVSPNECCGYIVKSQNEYRVFPCPNVSYNNEKFFEIDPRDYLRALDCGEIVAVYHSQQSARPSHLDCINTRNHQLRSIVYSWKHNTFCEASETLSPFMKYVGIDFEINKSDCFSLIRNFYKNEYDIFINDYFRNDNWYNNDPSIILDNYMKEGFSLIEYKDIKEGDVIVFGYMHFGIYLSNEDFLHHPRNGISTIDKLDDRWIKHIKMIGSHNDR